LPPWGAAGDLVASRSIATSDSPQGSAGQEFVLAWPLGARRVAPVSLLPRRVNQLRKLGVFDPSATLRLLQLWVIWIGNPLIADASA